MRQATPVQDRLMALCSLTEEDMADFATPSHDPASKPCHTGPTSIRADSRRQNTARVLFGLTRGNPEDLHIRRTCFNPDCISPHHHRPKLVKQSLPAMLQRLGIDFDLFSRWQNEPKEQHVCHPGPELLRVDGKPHRTIRVLYGLMLAQDLHPCWMLRQTCITPNCICPRHYKISNIMGQEHVPLPFDVIEIPPEMFGDWTVEDCIGGCYDYGTDKPPEEIAEYLDCPLELVLEALEAIRSS